MRARRRRHRELGKEDDEAMVSGEPRELWDFVLDLLLESPDPFLNHKGKILQRGLGNVEDMQNEYTTVGKKLIYGSSKNRRQTHWDKEIQARSDGIYLTEIMTFLLKSKPERKTSWKKVVDIFHLALKLHRQGKSMIPMDPFIVSCVVQAWSRSHDFVNAGEEAERILRNMWAMQNHRPNTIVYNGVMHCWARSKGHPKAAENAARLLREMWTLNEEGKTYIRPNTITYTSLINAWSNSARYKSGIEAEKLLREMWDRGQTYLAARPNPHTYNGVIAAWSRSQNHPDAIENAKRLVKEMWDMFENKNMRFMAPDTISYNNLMGAYQRNAPRDVAVKEIQALYDEMLKYNMIYRSVTLKPNTRTFELLMTAWARSSDLEEAERRVMDLLATVWKRYNEGDKSLAPQKLGIILKNLQNKKERMAQQKEQKQKQLFATARTHHHHSNTKATTTTSTEATAG